MSPSIGDGGFRAVRESSIERVQAFYVTRSKDDDPFVNRRCNSVTSHPKFLVKRIVALGDRLQVNAQSLSFLDEFVNRQCIQSLLFLHQEFSRGLLQHADIVDIIRNLLVLTSEVYGYRKSFLMMKEIISEIMESIQDIEAALRKVSMSGKAERSWVQILEAYKRLNELTPPSVNYISVPAFLAGITSVGLLGEGGYGYLYKGMKDGVPMAVKIPKTKLDNNLSYKAVAVLSHFRCPFVLHMKACIPVALVRSDSSRNVFQTAETGYAVFTEYIDGDNLLAWCRKYKFKRMRDKFVVVMAQMVIALHSLHKFGLISLDLKPPNFMISTKGLVKVIDLENALSVLGSFIGDPLSPILEVVDAITHRERAPDTCSFPVTASFVSPEAAVGRRYSKLGRANDWYSLGATFYNMVSDSREHQYVPKLAAWPARIFKGILENEGYRPLCVDDDSINDLLLRMTRPDPQERLCNLKNVCDHPFFRNVNWNDTYNQTAQISLQPFAETRQSSSKHITSLEGYLKFDDRHPAFVETKN